MNAGYRLYLGKEYNSFGDETWLGQSQEGFAKGWNIDRVLKFELLPDLCAALLNSTNAKQNAK